jgi:hypothetical protein
MRVLIVEDERQLAENSSDPRVTPGVEQRQKTALD